MPGKKIWLVSKKDKSSKGLRPVTSLSDSFATPPRSSLPLVWKVQAWGEVFVPWIAGFLSPPPGVRSPGGSSKHCFPFHPHNPVWIKAFPTFILENWQLWLCQAGAPCLQAGLNSRVNGVVRTREKILSKENFPLDTAWKVHFRCLFGIKQGRNSIGKNIDGCSSQYNFSTVWLQMWSSCCAVQVVCTLYLFAYRFDNVIVYWQKAQGKRKMWVNLLLYFNYNLNLPFCSRSWFFHSTEHTWPARSLGAKFILSLL